MGSPFNAVTTSKLDRLFSHAGDCLSGKTEINVFDVEVAQPFRWTHRSCLSHTSFKEAISEPRATDLKTRIISFHCPLTVLPLQACEDDLRVVFEAYQVNPLFADTVMAFGARPRPEEGGSSPSMVVHSIHGAPLECWYRLRYMEKNNRSDIDPWSPRHTIVYHSFAKEEDFHLILLFHPSDRSIFERNLINVKTDSNTNNIFNILTEDPFDVHVLLCDTYLGNWKEHLRDHAEGLRSIDDDIEDIDLIADAGAKDLGLIRKLQRYHKVASNAAVFCQGNNSILQDLMTFTSSNDDIASPQRPRWLETMASLSTDYAAGYRLLKDGVKDSIEHLQYTVNHQNQALALKNQQAAARLNETLLQLTYNTADDGATIKVITVLGLIFLPGSFIATLFGMNFFNYDEDHNRLELGNNIWVFLAFWISLTALTLSIYAWFALRRRAVRRGRTKTVVDSAIMLQSRAVV